MQEDALKYKKHATELNMNSYRQKKRIFYLKKITYVHLTTYRFLQI